MVLPGHNFNNIRSKEKTYWFNFPTKRGVAFSLVSITCGTVTADCTSLASSIADSRNHNNELYLNQEEGHAEASLVFRPRVPPGEKRSGERS